MTKQKRGVSAKAEDGLSGGIFLIGLGVLFLVDEIDFWPWILVVIGLSSLPSTFGHGDPWGGLQTGLWMVGLAFIFNGTLEFWPGMLILIGLSVMLGALTPSGSKAADHNIYVHAELGDLPDDEFEHTFNP